MTDAELQKLMEMALERNTRGTYASNHDADTITFNMGGLPTEFRVKGVDALEADQPYGDEVTKRVKKLLQGRTVRDTGNDHDVYHRRVNRLTLDNGDDLGETLVKQGLAAVPPVYGDEDENYRNTLIAAEKEAKRYGAGMWNPIAKTDGEMPWDQRNRKAREAASSRGEYAEEAGFLEKVGGGLDYLANIARSGLSGALDPRSTAIHNATQAYNKERYTSPSDLKDSVTKNFLGINKPVRLGTDGNGLDLGDIADFGIDLGVGVLTDPLTLLGAGPVSKLGGAALRGAAGLSKLPKVAAAITDAGVGRAMLGSAIGAGMVGDGGGDDDVSLTKRLGAAALSGMAAAFAPRISGSVATIGSGVGNALVDKYMDFTRGAGEFTAKSAIASPAIEEGMNFAAAGPMRYHANVLRDLPNPDMIKFWNLLKRGKSIEVGKREAWLAANKNAAPEIREGVFGKIRDEMQGWLRNEANALGKNYADSAESVFAESKHVVDKFNAANPQDVPIAGFGVYVPDNWASELGTQTDIEKSFADHAWRKAQSMERQNSELTIAVEQFVKAGGSGLSKADAAQALELINNRAYYGKNFSKEMAKQVKPVQDFVAGVLTGSIKMSDDAIAAGIKHSIDVDYRKKAWFTVDKSAREAIEYVNDVLTRPVGMGPEGPINVGHPGIYLAKKMETALEGWDTLQRFIVSNQLFGTLGWVKNNFWENSSKAYLSGGLPGLIDGLRFNKARRETWSDLFAMAHGSGTPALKTADINDLASAVELGVVSNPAARTLGSKGTEDLQKFMYSPHGLRRAQERMAALESRNVVYKAADWWGDFLGAHVGRVGSTLEANSRYSTWLRMRNSMIEANPKTPLAEIEKAAADFVKRTYYDYGDIGEFTKRVTKRIAPYAAYYIKNIPYYFGAMFDTSTIGKEWATRAMRMGVMEKAVRAVGGELRADEREGIDDWLLFNRPRVLSRSQEGISVGVMPSFSRDDALRMMAFTHPTEMAKSYLEKVSPAIKAPLEVLSGYDTFTGGPLYPSALKATHGESTGRKSLFGRGFLGAAAGMSVDVDDRGNPYTQSDLYAGFDKLRSAYIPMPGLEAAAAITGQHIYGKRNAASGVVNKFISPMMEVDVSKSWMNATRSRKKGKKDE